MSEIMTIENLKQAFPDLYGAIEKAAYDNGFAIGQTEGKSAGLIEGAESERTRIKGVEDQLIAGHEDLVASLKYDGITTGPEAAVKILAAEKTLRSTKLAAFTEEHSKVAVPAVPPLADDKKTEADDSSLPPEERAKKVWDADQAVRAEFKNDFNAYKAFVVAEAAGQVKIYRGGK